MVQCTLYWWPGTLLFKHVEIEKTFSCLFQTPYPGTIKKNCPEEKLEGKLFKWGDYCPSHDVKMPLMETGSPTYPRRLPQQPSAWDTLGWDTRHSTLSACPGDFCWATGCAGLALFWYWFFQSEALPEGMDALLYTFSAGNSTAAASHHVGLPGAFPLESWKPSLRMLGFVCSLQAGDSCRFCWIWYLTACASVAFLYLVLTTLSIIFCLLLNARKAPGSLSSDIISPFLFPTHLPPSGTSEVYGLSTLECFRF